MRKDQISIQLYTLRSITANDWDAALGQVAEAGYQAVEFAGFNGTSAADMRALLDHHGLKASSAHVLIAANPDRIGLVHLKDGNLSDLTSGKDVPFGEGTLDWDAILAASRAAGVEWYVTEQDTPNPDDILGDITTALRNAERMAS